MAWTTVTGTVDNIDEEIASFEATVTSIDAFSCSSHSPSGQVVAVIQYTA